MTSEARAPQGTEWADVIDVLHGLTNALMVRQLYREGHPAIARADESAAAGFARLLERLPELVLASLDGEFVVSERPMPELRKRLTTLASAMDRLEVDCMIFRRGLTAVECTALARTLASAQALAAPAKKLRDQARAELTHVLLRSIELRALAEEKRRGSEAFYFVPLVASVLQPVRRSFVEETPIDARPVVELAERIVRACEEGLFLLEPIAYAEGVDNEPAHATNVAMMTGAMAIAAGLAERTTVELTAAALVHDLGRTLLPDHVRAVPEPLLTEEQKAIYRHHAFIGASALLTGGAPPLWVAAALEHHRGVDGRGYPRLASGAAPDPLVRMIALASFIDSKRARAGVHGAEPDDALSAARALEGRFFGQSELHLFARALGVFPAGTTVELSDRRAAIVTRANASDPARPVVMLLTGDDPGKRAELHTVDAAEDRHHLSIVRAIPPPLLVRERPAEATVSATRLPAVSAEEIEVTVIEAVESEDLELDMPMSLPPSAPSSARWPARTSGVYSSLREEEPESLRFGGPTSSMPPPVSAPLAAATVPPAPSISLERVPVVRATKAEIAKAPLDPRAGFVLSLVDSMSDLETIVDASGMSSDDVLRVIDRLLSMGIIELR